MAESQQSSSPYGEHTQKRNGSAAHRGKVLVALSLARRSGFVPEGREKNIAEKVTTLFSYLQREVAIKSSGGQRARMVGSLLLDMLMRQL